MVISMANMSNKKPPPRYIIHFTHSGAVCWDNDGGGGDDADADGDDDEAGGGDGTDGDGDDGDAIETDGSGSDSVVKAPTALQALLVSELIALTFQ